MVTRRPRFELEPESNDKIDDDVNQEGREPESVEAAAEKGNDTTAAQDLTKNLQTHHNRTATETALLEEAAVNIQQKDAERNLILPAISPKKAPTQPVEEAVLEETDRIEYG